MLNGSTHTNTGLYLYLNDRSCHAGFGTRKYLSSRNRSSPPRWIPEQSPGLNHCGHQSPRQFRHHHALDLDSGHSSQPLCSNFSYKFRTSWPCWRFCKTSQAGVGAGGRVSPGVSVGSLAIVLQSLLNEASEAMIVLRIRGQRGGFINSLSTDYDTGCLFPQ